MTKPDTLLEFLFTDFLASSGLTATFGVNLKQVKNYDFKTIADFIKNAELNDVKAMDIFTYAFACGCPRFEYWEDHSHRWVMYLARKIMYLGGGDAKE